ncbi:hypothetical protein BRD00_10615 [Halobacteriales archaeon QS_8_69_26]|nr:MAG: hypothetical protein BRD00_10615 [Halobacteriales archaeon QS_8_69_26]
MVNPLQIVLILLRLVLFGLALGLTVISFQAYSAQKSKRLEYAFIGFAFISMGTALSNLTVQVSQVAQEQGVGENVVLFQIAETVPFIVGFSMLYYSLYR